MTIPMRETPKVPGQVRQTFDPFDRTPLEAARERMTVRRDTPKDAQDESQDIRDCFRVNRYGK